MKHTVAFCLLVFFTASCQPAALIETPSDANTLSTDTIQTKALSGGKATVFDKTKEAFSHRIPGTELSERTQFFTGESLFDQNWVAAPASTQARDGLGPLFNARSCAACHGKDGRSNPFESATEPAQALLVRLGASNSKAHARFGGQLQPFALPKIQAEGQLNVSWSNITGRYADGATYTLSEPTYSLPFENISFSVRQSPQLVGLGLLEQISETDILKQADPEDVNGDGISGLPNYVWNVSEQKDTLGKFGWKANQPTIEQQVAGAFNGDIGITTSVFPYDDTTLAQQEEHEKAYGGDVPNGGDPELSDRLLDRVTFYVQKLAVPARRNIEDPQVVRGEQLFSTLKCQQCHTSTFKLPQSGDVIHPYTDLLLHDMGPELADNRPDFKASGTEWRTPPLWGVGLIQTVNGHTRFMHDGRARNFTEAVLWHGGEAASSRDAFKALSAEERRDLITFLESL